MKSAQTECQMESSNLNLASVTQVTGSYSGIQICLNKQLKGKHPFSWAGMLPGSFDQPITLFMISIHFAGATQ